MTFPPDVEREPRRAKAWALIREIVENEGGPHVLDALVGHVAEQADVQPKTVASLVSSAKRQGYARFERRAIPADPWRVRFDFDACLVCGAPREGHAEPRSQELTVDASAPATVARLRGAEGSQRWLDGMATAGLVAAIGPIEPAELEAAALEFRPGLEGARFRAAVMLLTDDLGLIELDASSDGSRVFYRMVSD